MDCLKKENLNKFLAGEIIETERQRIEMHLADCPNCRLSLNDLYGKKLEEFFPAPKYLKEKAKRLPEKEKAANPFFSFLFTRQTALAMASFIVLFSLIGFWVFSNTQDQTDNGTDILRQGGETTNSPILSSPANNANLSDEEITFEWQKLDGANSYVLIVSDEKGDIILEKQTKEESLIVKTSEAKLIPKKHYFWYIRAKFIDGKITEALPRKFTFMN